MVQMISLGAPLETPRVLRVRFHKIGVFQYISHLDLMRTMTRVMARSHLPVRYTNGFNPKPHLVFSAPLPVGAESPREFVDVEVLREVDLDEVKAVLNSGLPEDLAVEEVYYAETKFSAITAAEYRITLFLPGADAALADACAAALEKRPIVVCKRTKSGDRDVDISPAIRSVSACYEAPGKIILTVTLAADSGSFLNPDYLVNHLRDTLGILQGSPLEEWYTVYRAHLFTADGSDFF